MNNSCNVVIRGLNKRIKRLEKEAQKSTTYDADDFSKMARYFNGDYDTGRITIQDRLFVCEAISAYILPNREEGIELVFRDAQNLYSDVSFSNFTLKLSNPKAIDLILTKRDMNRNLQGQLGKRIKSRVSLQIE